MKIASNPLQGCRVLVTRERPGDLAAQLIERGATVVHLPLIAVIEPTDGGAALNGALSRLAEFDWLIVTSPAGSERVGAAAIGAPAVEIDNYIKKHAVDLIVMTSHGRGGLARAALWG